MTDIDKCPDCKNEYDENDVWHGVIDLQLWKTTSICEGCFEEDGGYRYKSNADIEGLITEVERLREQGRKLVEAAERVRSDISDQDTGWYYQLGGHIERMNRLVSE